MTDAVKYMDDDLVYVDPETKTVVGKVEFGKDGLPKPKKYAPPIEKVAPVPAAPVAGKDAKPGDKPAKRPRSFNRKFYPWGTYRSMKKVFKVEGKQKEPESNSTLDEVLPKALENPFW